MKMKYLIVILILFSISPSIPLAQTAETDLPKGVIKITSRSATAFSLNDIDGNTYHYNPASGHWSFVHFWASWCGPCRKEIPTLQTLTARMKNKSLDIIIINTAETEDTVFSFLGGVAPDLNSLLDTDGEVTEQWQPRGLPSTYLVDPLGNLRYVVLGGQPWNKPEYFNFLLSLTPESKLRSIH
jgi:thiol-disulfide isomerase/thioredoxin